MSAIEQLAPFAAGLMAGFGIILCWRWCRSAKKRAVKELDERFDYERSERSRLQGEVWQHRHRIETLEKALKDK